MNLTASLRTTPAFGSALTLLAARSDRGAESGSVVRASSADSRGSAVRFSSRASDAVMQIVKILGASGTIGATPNGNRPDDGLAANVTDSWAWYNGPSVSEEEFQTTVLNNIKSTDAAKDDPALRDAIANGTIKIRHAEEVEGLGYQMNMTFQYGDYGLIQGVSMDQRINGTTYDQDVADGKRAIVGWQGGGIGSYYVTY